MEQYNGWKKTVWYGNSLMKDTLCYEKTIYCSTEGGKRKVTVFQNVIWSDDFKTVVGYEPSKFSYVVKSSYSGTTSWTGLTDIKDVLDYVEISLFGTFNYNEFERSYKRTPVRPTEFEPERIKWCAGIEKKSTTNLINFVTQYLRLPDIPYRSLEEQSLKQYQHKLIKLTQDYQV
jgi:hypothetical protein